MSDTSANRDAIVVVTNPSARDQVLSVRKIALGERDPRNLALVDAGCSGKLLLGQVMLLTQLAQLTSYGVVSVDGIPAR